MNDDIVARLRTFTDTLLLGDFQGLAGTTESAADEIERLRAELCEARQVIFRLQTNAACCRTSPAATTRDGEATFIPEAL